MDKNKQEAVKKQAKQILDKFAKALEKVDDSGVNFYVDREEFEREEKKGKEGILGFKDSMLKNAPRHDKDFIMAEKGNWK